MQPFAAIAETVAIDVGIRPWSDSCQQTWSITTGPRGAASLDTRDPQVVQFKATEPGLYTVQLDCGGFQASATVGVFQPTLAVRAKSRNLSPGCMDSAITDDGKRLLCAWHGVQVFDLETGALLGQTPEHSPDVSGLATQGDLFAIAAKGCSHCGDPPIDMPAGVLLYRLEGDGTPALLSQLTQEPANEVGFGTDSLFVTTSQHLFRYAIRDPMYPTVLGCAAGSYASSTPIAEHDALLIVDPQSVSSIALASIGQDCSQPVTPMGQVSLAKPANPLWPTFNWAWDPTGPAGQQFLFLSSAYTPVDILDLRQPLQPVRARTLDLDADGLAVSGDRLLLRTSGFLYVFDVHEVESGMPLKPLGSLKLYDSGATRIWTAGGQIHIVSLDTVWTVTIQ